MTTLALIPYPVKVTSLPGKFILDENVCLQIADGLKSSAGILTNTFRMCGINIHDAGPGGKTKISVELDDSLSAMGEEGYQLTILKDAINIRAYKKAGAFYAIQTLLQLCPAQIYQQDASWVFGPIELPCLSITDRPRFIWRGLHLDVVRHFMPLDFIKKFLSLMAVHKLNTFHWHLTDHEGWRIEIKNYPQFLN
jgi:hexosaminidase